MTAPSDRITTAAARYVLAVDNACALRKARNALDCAHMPPPMDGEGMAGPLHPDGQPWQQEACWKMHVEQTGPETIDEYRFGDGSHRGWCASCEKRQKLHAEYLTAVRKRGGALASLRAAVRRGGA